MRKHSNRADAKVNATSNADSLNLGKLKSSWPSSARSGHVILHPRREWVNDVERQPEVRQD